MNPKILAVAVLALPLAYLGGTAYIGKKTETGITEFTKKITDFAPSVKVVKQNYQSGFFSSTDETTLSYGEKPSDQIILRTSFEHGPLPGLTSFGSTRATTTFVFAPQVQAQLQKLFGDQKPVTIVTTTGFAGGYDAQITSPAAKANFEGNNLDWKGLKSIVSKSGSGYVLDLTSEGLTSIDAAGTRVQIKGLKLGGNASPMKGFEDVWLGKSSMSIDGFETSNTTLKTGTTKIGKTVIDTDFDTKAAGFVDQLIKFNIANFEMDGETFGAATFNYGVKHIDAAALNVMGKAILKGSSTASKTGADADSAQMAAQQVSEALKTAGIDILKNQPIMEIEKMSITMPGGESKMSGVFKLGTLTAEQLQMNPMLLLSKIEATGDLQISKLGFKQLIAAQQKSSVKKMGASEQDVTKMVNNSSTMMDAQIQQMVTQGFASEKDGVVSSKIIYKDGQLLLNGKPFNSMALR
jgi:uncharacterized protein YdgA (DUF945 family)